MGKGRIKKVCSNTFEHEYWSIDKLVIGIDEAGRGPIAGPEVVAGVVFPIGYHNEDIYDSKAISEKKREELFEVIKKDALEFHIEIVSEKVIDIIKGDQKSVSIAAASILAKVTRDRIMYELDKKYPEYDFKHNKGYPTKKHLEALEQYGALDIHRRSYGPVYKLDQMKFDI